MEALTTTNHTATYKIIKYSRSTVLQSILQPLSRILRLHPLCFVIHTYHCVCVIVHTSSVQVMRDTDVIAADCMERRRLASN